MWISNSNWRRQDFQWHDDPAAGAPFDSNSSGDVMPACRYTVLQNHPELPWIASIWTMDEWNVPHCWRWPISGIWTFGLPLLLMPLKAKDFDGFECQFLAVTLCKSCWREALHAKARGASLRGQNKFSFCLTWSHHLPLVNAQFSFYRTQDDYSIFLDV